MFGIYHRMRFRCALLTRLQLDRQGRSAYQYKGLDAFQTGDSLNDSACLRCKCLRFHAASLLLS